MSFAENTVVPVERSRAEIERLLVRYGASRFGSMHDETRAVIAFEMSARAIRMVLPLPKRDEKRFTHGGRYGYRISDAEAQKRFDQEVRRRWRALALVIKAKLEAVESGIVTFDDEWLAHFVLPGGRTVGETVKPELLRAYESGQAPRLLIGFSGKDDA